MTQESFDRMGWATSPPGEMLRDAAIVKLAATHGAWIYRVLGWIAAMPSGHEFTSDELWQRSAELAQTLAPRERRAMGAALKQAAQRELIESSGRYEKSTRPECHARPVLVWRRR